MDYNPNSLSVRTIRFLFGKIDQKNAVIEQAHKHIKKLEKKICKMKRAEAAVASLGRTEIRGAVYVLVYVVVTKIKIFFYGTAE